MGKPLGSQPDTTAGENADTLQIVRHHYFFEASSSNHLRKTHADSLA